MRGNEWIENSNGTRYLESSTFAIPMRGNEKIGLVAGESGDDVVCNPHEG